MNGIQSRNHKIGTYKIDMMLLSCFNKINTLNNGYDGLALDNNSWIWVKSYFNKNQKKFSVKL